MPVRQRGKSWQADFRWEGQRVRDTFAEEKAAEQWITESLKGLQDGTLVIQAGVPVPKTPQAVAAISEAETQTMEWLAKLTYDTLWKDTSNAAKAKANATRVVEMLGAKKHPSKAITALAVREAVAAMKNKDKQPATINRHLSALGRMIKVAREIGMEINIADLPWQNEKGNERSRQFTDEEETQITDAFEQMERPDMRDLYLVLVDTGMRLSEALGLTVKDVERFEAGDYIRVWGSRKAKDGKAGQRTKNNESRSMPMTIRVAATLKSRKAAMPLGEQRFFWTLDLDRAEKFWRQMRDKLGKQDDPEFVMHTCRHTFASRLAKTGASSLELMLVGGWKTESMVKRYGHLHPEHSKSLIDRLNKRAVNPLEA